MLSLAQAKEDLRTHIAYIAQHNPEAAERTRARIIGRIRMLRNYPMLGRPGRVPDTRELVISGTRYLAIYTLLAETVYIVHINHGAQQWPPDESNEDDSETA